MSGYWVDEEQQHFHCDYKESDPFSCGFNLSFSGDATKGADLSAYDGLRLNIKYTGDAPHIRIFMRDFNPKYDASNDPNLSSKFMSVAVSTADLNAPAFVRMSEFSVNGWWIRDFNVPRVHSAPEFTNVTTLGIDFSVHSSNDLEIENIELVGVWIKQDTLYLWIIVAWLALIIGETGLKIYYQCVTLKHSSARVNRFITAQKSFESVRQSFETLSTTDVLTGVMNRAGVHQVLLNLSEGGSARKNNGVLLFDVDNFKQINERYGRDGGDRVLHEMAKLIAQTTRQTDIFGRWDGETFILICPQLPVDHLIAFAEKVRLTISEFTFEKTRESLNISVSIGATLSRADESFDSILARTEAALYEAKNRGRNRVVFKEV